jgi:DNA-binding GntR family transcriptional regulator
MSAEFPGALVPRAPLADAVYERLRDDIVRDVLADGSNLNQVQLAERYGVSRIPVREALRRLQAEQLVKATPYHQYVVSKPTGKQILELVDIRMALEDLALEKAAPLTDARLEELQGLNEQMRSSHGEEFLALDRQFHQLIAGPDRMVAEMIADLRARIHMHLTTMVSEEPGRSTATDEHERLLAALAGGDMVRARLIMREHVTTSRDFIVRRLEAAGRSPQ